jgi:hypothetical protein
MEVTSGFDPQPMFECLHEVHPAATQDRLIGSNLS